MVQLPLLTRVLLEIILKNNPLPALVMVYKDNYLLSLSILPINNDILLTVSISLVIQQPLPIRVLLEIIDNPLSPSTLRHNKLCRIDDE